jgi:hypothetical protein
MKASLVAFDVASYIGSVIRNEHAVVGINSNDIDAYPDDRPLTSPHLKTC